MTTRTSNSASLSDLIRRESSAGVPGLPKCSLSSVERRNLGSSMSSSAEWQDVVNQVTALFQTKKMTMKLQELTDKVINVKAAAGNSIIDYYKESILKKGMIILREEVREKSGEYLNKLANCWTVFFCNILPTLQAIFASLPQANGLPVREISLVYFRDIVVLKTKLDEAIATGLEIPPRIIQMLLVLQSVHDTNVENYQKLERLVAKTVSPYLSTSVLQDSMINKMVNGSSVNEAAEQHQMKSYLPANERLDPVLEVDTGSQRSSVSSMSATFGGDLHVSSQTPMSTSEEYHTMPKV